PVGERPRRAVVHGEEPFDARVRQYRHGQRRLDALQLEERLRVVPQTRIVRIVLRPERTAGQQDLAGEPVARHDLSDGRRRSAGPVAEQYRLGRRVAGSDDAEVGSTELTGGVAYALQDRVEIERGGDLARQLREDLGLAPAALGVLEEARLLERPGRLVHERLRQTHLVAVVGAAFVVADGDGADDPVVDDHRQRERRQVRPRLERFVELGGQRDPRIGEDVRRRDGAPRAHGAAHGPGPRGERDVVAGAVGRDVPAYERAGDRL